MAGKALSLDRPNRSVHTEHFQMPGATPTTVESLFGADGDGTLLTLTITYESEEALDMAISYGMADGMEASNARLDAL